MRLVILESPYAGDVTGNIAYARVAMRDAIKRGDAPFASHLLYTQLGILDDGDPEERQIGIDAGLLWGKHAVATVAYIGLGISSGMAHGIARAWDEGRPVEWRILDGRLADGQTESEVIAEIEQDLIAEVEKITGRRRPALARLISDVAEAIETYGDDLLEAGAI